MKCRENHEPEQCDLSSTNNDKNLLYCAKCNKPEHPTSYRGCPYFKFFKVRKNKEHTTHPTGQRTCINEAENLIIQSKIIIHNLISTTPHNHDINLFSNNPQASFLHQRTNNYTRPNINEKSQTHNRFTRSENSWKSHSNNIDHLFNNNNFNTNCTEPINDLNYLLQGIRREIISALDSKLSNFQVTMQRAIDTNSINIKKLFNHLGLNLKNNYE